MVLKGTQISLHTNKWSPSRYRRRLDVHQDQWLGRKTRRIDPNLRICLLRPFYFITDWVSNVLQSFYGRGDRCRTAFLTRSGRSFEFAIWTAQGRDLSYGKTKSRHWTPKWTLFLKVHSFYVVACSESSCQAISDECDLERA